jgi:hypothetical protein
MKRNYIAIEKREDGKNTVKPERRFYKTLLAGLLLLLLFPLQAMAGTDRLVLDFGDGHFRSGRGYSSTLFLKKALLEQYPGINISDYRLRKVVVVAKSKIGRGDVQLRVGPEVTDRYRVAGDPRGFYSDHPRSFDRVRIHNPFADSWGPWQLLLNGNFKVRKVVLVVEQRHPRRHGHHHGHNYDWGPNQHFSFKMRW